MCSDVAVCDVFDAVTLTVRPGSHCICRTRSSYSQLNQVYGYIQYSASTSVRDGAAILHSSKITRDKFSQIYT